MNSKNALFTVVLGVAVLGGVYVAADTLYSNYERRQACRAQGHIAGTQTAAGDFVCLNAQRQPLVYDSLDGVWK